MIRLIGYYTKGHILDTCNTVKIYTDDFETFYYEDGTIIPVETITWFVYSLFKDESDSSYIISRTKAMSRFDVFEPEFTCRYYSANTLFTSAIFGYGNDEETALQNTKEIAKILKEKFKKEVEKITLKLKESQNIGHIYTFDSFFEKPDVETEEKVDE